MSEDRRALIVGIGGQDGLYLAELLSVKGYEVYGLMRPESSRWSAVRELLPGASLITGDLTDAESLVRAIEHARPTEVYNLAAVSSVARSFTAPTLTAEINGIGAARLMEAIRKIDSERRIRFYQASSSEIFGATCEAVVDEHTPIAPSSPYGAAKAYAHSMTAVYRSAYDMFAVAGILMNHESPRRPVDFVTRKITRAAARISLGLEGELKLGNLDARRDWGFAGDYVEGMWRMLQQEEPRDFLLATGVAHSVREFCEEAFRRAGISDWLQYVQIDPLLQRPQDIPSIIGNPGRAERILNWRAATSFVDLVNMMVDHDLREAQQSKATLSSNGTAQASSFGVLDGNR